MSASVLGGLQHQVSEPRPRRHARRALGGVDPREFAPEVVLMRGLRRQARHLVSAGHNTNCHTAGVDQVDRHAAERLGQRADSGTGRLGQPQHIRLVLCGVCGCDESRPGTSPDQHAG